MPLDSDDIARLYGIHARRLVAFFARRTFDPVAAGELMAETFADAVADRRTFRGDGDAAAAAWLYGIALSPRRLRGRARNFHLATLFNPGKVAGPPVRTHRQ